MAVFCPAQWVIVFLEFDRKGYTFCSMRGKTYEQTTIGTFRVFMDSGKGHIYLVQIFIYFWDYIKQKLAITIKALIYSNLVFENQLDCFSFFYISLLVAFVLFQDAYILCVSFVCVVCVCACTFVSCREQTVCYS